jgi:hypothetical protein
MFREEGERRAIRYRLAVSCNTLRKDD